jgi:hypothetical protein
LGSPRRQPQIPSTSECRFNKSPHHQNACSVLVGIKKNPGPGGALPPGGCSGAPPRRLPAFAPAIVVRACVRACVFLSVCLCVCVCNACVVRARVFERAWGVRVGAGRSVLVSVCPECRQAVAGRVALFRGRAKGVRHWWTCSRWVTERGGDKVRRRRGGRRNTTGHIISYCTTLNATLNDTQSTSCPLVRTTSDSSASLPTPCPLAPRPANDITHAQLARAA